MAEKAEVINLEPVDITKRDKEIQLDSGRQIRVHPLENEEVLEIVEPEGEVVLKIRLTEKGPIVSVQGAHLELKSTESISMESKRVTIRAEEKAVVKSCGTLEIDSSDEMDIHSDNDIHVVGKMIHLN